MNLIVLIVSLSLAVVAAIVLYAIFYGGETSMSTPDPAPTEQTARAVTAYHRSHHQAWR